MLTMLAEGGLDVMVVVAAAACAIGTATLVERTPPVAFRQREQ